MSNDKPYTTEDEQEVFVRTKLFHKQMFTEALENEVNLYIQRIEALIDLNNLDIDVESFDFYDEIADDLQKICLMQIGKLRDKASSIMQYRGGKSYE